MATNMLLPEIARQWRTARRLYPVYVGLREMFHIDVPPCPDLEQSVDRSEPGAVTRVWEWFDDMDHRVQVHQLRQLLQGTTLATPENISALIRRHLDKPRKNSADRDKIDFLLVQYFAHRAPPDVKEEDVTIEHVVETLLPILGDVPLTMPTWAPQLDKALDGLTKCQTLPDLLQRGILEEARWLKEGVGTSYFQPIALVLFTRFNYRVRLVFFRLMHGDLHAIRLGLTELQKRRFVTIDCRQANLSEEEPIANLLEICTEWKTPFRAAYSAGQNFRQILAIRAAVDRALAQNPSTLRPFYRPDVAPLPLAGAAASAEAKAVVERELISGTLAAVSWTSLEDCVRDITEQLAGRPRSGNEINLPFAVVNLPAGESLALSSWETQSFSNGHNKGAELVKRAVAAVAYIKDTAARRDHGQEIDMAAAALMAEAELAAIESGLAEAKSAKIIDDVVSLAATGRRLRDRCKAAVPTAANVPAAPRAKRFRRRGKNQPPAESPSQG